MREEPLLPQSAAVEAILVTRRRMEAARNPDLRLSGSTVLKDGPKAKKIATHWVITNRRTGELHHHSVKIETWRRRGAPWELDDYHCVTLSDGGPEELSRLRLFLDTLDNPNVPELTGDYFVVPIASPQAAPGAAYDVLTSISTPSAGAAIGAALSQIASNPEALEAFVQNATDDPDGSRFAAAAINLGLFRSAIQQLRDLIEHDAEEREYQRLLHDNPWMFGSEYSELLDRRHFTRDDQQDFMLRRTADAFLEVIEIKTALGGADLFVRDRSRDVWYPRAELSAALAQVLGYLEELDADRLSIKARDSEDVNKVRAKIIIGRDRDQHQVNALRRLNGHLHRVEILTFDQLLRIAERVVSYLARDVRAPS
jgi:hypothetical protein